jgi:hypothetical protein
VLKNVYVRNVQVPNCGSVFNLTATKLTSTQSVNVTGFTGCTGSQFLSYKMPEVTKSGQNVPVHKALMLQDLQDVQRSQFLSYKMPEATKSP